MKKHIFFFFFLLISLTGSSQLPWSNGNLRISENGRFLQHDNGTPFFWLADTGWLIFQRLDRDEAKLYFEDRKAKGFNVVQCIFYQSYRDDNVYGDTAYINTDISQPKCTPGNNPADAEAYDFWDHVDYMVDLAAQNGIYLAIAPTWGQLFLRDKTMTTEKAAAFAKLLAVHFKDKPNIVWLNGGSAKGNQNTTLWETIGTTIKQFDPNHLMTFHTFGRMSSSDWFHNASWLDFNMFTSGHRRYDQDDTARKYGEDNWRYVLENSNRNPVKPILDGEPSYESLPQGLHDHSQPYWTAADVRRYAYWSVFAGSCGHTYGQNSVRQVYKAGVNKPESGAKISFNEALNDSGAFCMQYLKQLILSRPFPERINDQSVVAGDEGEMYNRILVTRGKHYLMAYTYTGRDFTLNPGSVRGKILVAWWYNPRSGRATLHGKFRNKGEMKFNPPGEPQAGNDWVLILDDSAQKFNTPGIQMY